MSYRLVLFDYDGTLADSFPWLLSVINQVASQYHLPRVEPNDYETLRRLDARQIIRSMGFSFWKIPLIARDICRISKIMRVNRPKRAVFCKDNESGSHSY